MRDFHQPGRSAVFAQSGMCATSHPLAAKVALDMLQQGGNAMDAAIAGAILLGICEPQMTGIGGDCFALVKPAGMEDIFGINGSGRAPAALSAETLRAEGHSAMPRAEAASISIPGAIDAFCTMNARWGQLDLATLLAPTIHYAEAGIPVAPRVAFDWLRDGPRLQGAARTHYLHNDAAPAVGTLFRAPGQAEVLRHVAREGRDGFYAGPVAEDMVNSLRAAGGVHTLEDFAATACSEVTPIRGTYKGTELVELPPNSHGATAILMTNMLSCFDLQALDPFGTARAHIEAEVAKLAYDTRNRIIADADHTTRLAHMTSMDTAEALAGLIDPKRAMADPAPLSDHVHRETIYITVVDANRMAVSLIYSIFDGFGSGIASDRYGILFQNRAAGFTLEAGHPNEAGGGKRPMHTIIPGMLRQNDKLVMPFGVMGGPYQPNGHARVLTNMVDYGLDPQAALDAPRSFYDPRYGLQVERGYADNVHAELAEMGHTVVIPDAPIGGAQAIWIDPETGILQGASDPRKDGCALGY
ncbi:gamma-glutamyltransferase family protein [Dinoroseobacter sp. S124A]|uniref:gamma-glutamyltransferase family protein n=1 Tax=Dinoroseobacter sp. S124A TaxID=3415128 RepID=UPI003C7B8E21